MNNILPVLTTSSMIQMKKRMDGRDVVATIHPLFNLYRFVVKYPNQRI